ncbi:MAG: 3-deoxy-D-manno-octulosonic acid transferase [Ferruginibacter sp.]|nr:3-deoxy-D-manno-octulosonic acid transferase [Ferruginibacter sp.]
MSLIFYNIFLVLYRAAIGLASVWDEKARHWIRGRENALPVFNEKTIWMHCASLGEFEQGRPVLEAVKKRFPHYPVVLTFFSPSGYEIRKKYTGADAVLYLPLDGKRRAQQTIQAINPALVLWVKYEYWYYHLTEVQKRNVPLILVSGIFRPHQPFFKWYGNLWNKMLRRFTVVFVQNEASYRLLEAHQLHQHAVVAGDTRFDRVTDVAANATAIPPVAAFCAQRPVLVAGSTWEEDEEVLAHYVRQHPEIVFIIAPHEVDEDNIRDVMKIFPDAVRFSRLQEATDQQHVLIIDNIGMLNRLYQYATVAYIGGGFRDSGIHNTLEAAVYGIPVVFGPVYEKFNEAVEMIETGCATSIENALELEQTLNDYFSNAHHRTRAGLAAKNYVAEHTGSTQMITDVIYEKRLLTN